MKKAKILSVTVAALVMVAVAGILLIHNRWTDRVNPFVPEQTSYAKVPQGKQRYRNVELYTATQTKPTLVLKEMTGYDPDGKYVTVRHKGQYVKRVTYVSKETFAKRTQQ
ncbi:MULTISPECIES: YxeA family protein [Lacticaseibacillus]|uniref:YxeA family protein n=3 Tax=Lacticaseibacillus TaxID=2759736 RepID=A0AAN1C5S8_LACCA|nr:MULTISPECIES: YxeA family protein [Lacticaseibacillus]ARY90321.1 hypothetical protein BGL52_00525 [Lacticaseibacillus casei]KAB1969936.1 YxeA family protein [Lacticaseibacillus casei]MDE3281237.1 YxeA family protein [Lacticaseibacillus casei]WLV78164.1 YxeA family protein [Lacticaseibacillus sp. NCIMB 15471]WLV80937.1 YxeA family protein [Lacticaseibacillus sp. NCIMB 15473]